MHLAKRVSSISASVTLAITSEVKKLQAQGIKVINFGTGEPDFDTPSHIKEAAVHAIEEGFTKYTPAAGMPELKQAIAAKFKKDNNLDYTPGQIVVSCGAKHSLYNILEVLCESGDEVLIPSPYWVSYPEMVKLAEAEPRIIPTRREHNFKLTPNLLKGAITKRTKALILNSPSNPTGAVYTKEELARVAEIVCACGIYLLSDEIYEKLVYEDNRHFSIASFNKDIYERTITINGVSKTYSMTGWRIGYLGGPRKIVSAASDLQSHSTSNPSSISQKAALAALTGDQGCVRAMLGEFAKRRDYTVERLNNMKGLSCIKPGGAFYAFVDISQTGMDSAAFARELLSKEGVALVPGRGFGWDDHIRISFAASMENLKQGLDKIERFVNNQKGTVPFWS